MATVAPHNLVTWRGTLGSREMWQFSLHFRDAAGVANSVSTANTLLNYFGTDLGTMIGQAAKCTEVRISRINATGSLAEPPTISDAVAVSGGNGATLQPFQVALAVSLRSAKVSGPGAHGRFYLPVPALATDKEGYVVAADKSKANTQVGAFLGHVRATMATYLGGTADPILVSRGFSTYEVVTRWAVGDVLDTMRSRRGALPELRAYAPLPT